MIAVFLRFTELRKGGLELSTMKDNLVFAPASKAQEQFLLSDAFFTIYGGEHCAS